MTELTLNQIDRKTRELNMESSYLFDNFTDRIIARGPLGNVLPVATDATTNVISTPKSILYCTNIQEQLLLCPTNVATGLNIGGDQANGDGFEIRFQEPAQADARFLFVIDSEPVGFFIEATFTVADISGVAELLVGFVKNDAYQAVRTVYTDYALIGCIGADIKIATDLNDAGETLTDTTENVADAGQVTLRVEVDSYGNVTYKCANSATAVLDTPTVTLDYTFDTGDTVVPVIRFLNDSDVAGTVVLNSLECGYLN